MSGDVSGVLDTRSALAREAAGLPESAAPLPEVVELDLGGAWMVLPYDADSIAAVLESVYRVNGFAGLEILYKAAVASYAAFLRLSDSQELSLTGTLAEKDAAVSRAQILIGDAGDQSANREALRERLSVRDLYAAPTRAALDRLDRERPRRAAQMQALREQIDTLAEIEEEAQRWYEGKLLTAIELDFAKRQCDLEALWQQYRIGDPKTGLPVWFKDAHSAKGLEILAEDDLATVVGGKPGAPVRVNGKDVPRVQGEEATFTVHAVIKWTHELALAQYRFRRAIETSRNLPARAARRVEANRLKAFPERQAYRLLLDSLPQAHFIAHAAHRGLYQLSGDLMFSEKKIAAAVIEAFLKARDTMPQLLADMRENLLFRDDDSAVVVGKDAMARPAAEVLIAKRYDERIVMVRAEEAPAANIFRSPWLQAPFHERLMQLADVFRAEGAEEAPAGAAIEAYAEVAHLAPLFEDEFDRRMLLWTTSLGTLAGRARVEMMRRLTERIESEAEMRRNVQLAVAAAGMVAVPFTAGKSLVVAGAIDAMLIADQSAADVERWIATKQFSKIVLDGIAAAHWVEPEVSQLVGQVLEAGFEIASDLVQAGAIGKAVDAISTAQLLLAVPDVAAALLKD